MLSWVPSAKQATAQSKWLNTSNLNSSISNLQLTTQNNTMNNSITNSVQGFIKSSIVLQKKRTPPKNKNPIINVNQFMKIYQKNHHLNRVQSSKLKLHSIFSHRTKKQQEKSIPIRREEKLRANEYNRGNSPNRKTILNTPHLWRNQLSITKRAKVLAVIKLSQKQTIPKWKDISKRYTIHKKSKKSFLTRTMASLKWNMSRPWSSFGGKRRRWVNRPKQNCNCSIKKSKKNSKSKPSKTRPERRQKQ